MPEEGCLHDMLPGQCAICLGQDRVDALTDAQVARVFTAGEPGPCAIDKAHRIHPGDAIGRLVDGGYSCESCTTELAR